MKTVCVLLSFIFLSFSLAGQLGNSKSSNLNRPPPPPPPPMGYYNKDNGSVKKDEGVPSFPGGDNELGQFIQKNIKYPEIEKEKGISGTCFVSFFVKVDGTITDVKIVKGIKDGQEFNNEAIRVIKLMPKWNPAKKNGQPIGVNFNLPIKFIAPPNENFGNYYKIGEFGIKVPFHSFPHIAPMAENNIFKRTSYSYCYPKSSDDINLMYSIEVYQLKDESSFKGDIPKVDYFVKVIKETMEAKFNGHLIKEEKSTSKGRYSVQQKMKINTTELPNTFMTSLFYLHNQIVIRLIVYTKNDADNKRIYEFFDSIKYE